MKAVLRICAVLVLTAGSIAVHPNAQAGPATVFQQEERGTPRAAAPVTFLQINDVYTALPVDGRGGLARLATIKKRLADSGRRPFMVLAGDFLSPSVESSVFRGEQMVAALNAAGLDLATLGNHELDFGVDVLLQRMRESRFQWVISNVIDISTRRPLGGAPAYLIRPFGALKVGFIGLTLTNEGFSTETLRRIRLVDPFEAAATYLPRLKREGAEVIVAVTHLTFADDRELARRFPAIDLIIGGHEHYPITATENRTLVSKAGSDAASVARIDINRSRTGVVERFYELTAITDAIPDDPQTAAVIDSFQSRLGRELEVVVGASRVPLDADSIRLRAGETNLGDLVADAIRTEVGADMAILNAGSIRGDRVYPAGPLDRRTLLAIHPFGNVVCKVAVRGGVAVRTLNHAVSRLPATSGQFPQVSGISFRVELSAPPGDRVRDVRVAGQPIQPDKTYSLAVTNYQLAGGDGYDLLANQPMLIDPESGPLVVTALEKFVASRGEVNPAVVGRIAISR